MVTLVNTCEFDLCIDDPTPEVNHCQVAGTYILQRDPCEEEDNGTFNCTWRYRFPTPVSLCAPESLVLFINCGTDYVLLYVVVNWLPQPGGSGLPATLSWRLQWPSPQDYVLDTIDCMQFSGTSVPVNTGPGGIPFWQTNDVPCFPFTEEPAVITALP
ncbi:MAG: hypothetical protein U0795_27045 [Pirellulales bacterium]